MKTFKTTDEHLNAIAQKLFNKNYEQLTREQRDQVFPIFRKEREQGNHIK